MEPDDPNLNLNTLPHFKEATTSEFFQPGTILSVYISIPDHASEGQAPLLLWLFHILITEVFEGA